MLSLDKTFIFQMVIFFALFYLLNRFLFRPILEVLEERRKKTEGKLKEARATDEEVEKGINDYERRLKETALKAQEEFAAARKEAVERGKAAVEKARLEADEEMKEAVGELNKTKEATFQRLREQVPGISKEIAEKILERAIPLVFLLLLLPAAAYCAEKEGEGGGFSWKVINFAVFAVAGYLIWKKKLKGLLEERKEGIKRVLAEAEQKKDEAEARLKEYMEKAGQFENRMEEVKRNIKEEAEAEKQRIIEEEELLLAKMNEQTMFAIGQEVKKAKEEIRSEIAELAVELSREILTREIRPDDQEKITKEYLEKLRLN